MRNPELLAELAELHGTDKRAEVHDYVRTYDRHLGPLRHRVRTVLELGVHAGASLRVWRDWMPRAEVHGLDLRKLPSVRGERLHLWRGDQCDAELLAQVVAAAATDVTAVLTPFRYCVQGKPLCGTLLPPRFNLIRPNGGHYVNDGHAHRFVPAGRTLVMRQPILHDDRKPLSRWLASQQRYLQQETQKLLTTPHKSLSRGDRLRTQAN